MLCKRSVRCWRLTAMSLAILSFVISAFALPQQSESPRSEKRHLYQMPPIALEIVSPHKSAPLYKGNGGMFLLRRDALSIVNQEAAKDLTAVDVWAIVEKEALKIRLSIIYNDLSNPEWWKDKKEKEIGNFMIPIGNSFSPIELLQFGIEPFEIKVISNKPVVLKVEEYPRIQNLTHSIEVVEVEKSIDRYRFTFKNTSNKNVVAFEVWSGNSGNSSASSRTSSKDFLIPSGETYERGNSFAVADIEQGGLTIKMVLFSDGTFEGDTKSATRYLARWEGEMVQAAKLLLMVEQTLNVADEELPEAFNQLEAQLQKMSEAMDKPSAIDYLKMKYLTFDEKTISMLYEEFKGGLYNARNYALNAIESIRRFFQRREGEISREKKVEMYEDARASLKMDLEKLASASRER